MAHYAIQGIGSAKMKSEEFLLGKPIFTTRDYAQSLDIRIESASRKLSEFTRAGFLKKASRGLWFNQKHNNFSVLSLVPHLVGSEQGYVSFLSALNYHGVISQIPQRIFVATTGHARKIKVNSYQYDFMQIKPEFMMFGIEWRETFAMASPEKALIDCYYLSSRKGKRFSHLPELDLSEIKKSKFRKLLKEHGFSKSIEVYIEERFEGSLA